MTNDRLTVEVGTATAGEARLAMRGDVDIAADETLAAAYATAAASGASRIVLDFTDVDYINSTGIALIVRLLAEARRDHRDGRGRGPLGALPRDLPDHPPVRLPDDRRPRAGDARHRGGCPMTATTVDVVRDGDRPRSSASTARSRAASEPPVMAAYSRRPAGAKSIVLDFSQLEYMNSGGIGLLVTLLVRAQRAGQRTARGRAVRPLPPDPRADPPRRGDRHPRRRSRPRSRPRRPPERDRIGAPAMTTTEPPCAPRPGVVGATRGPPDHDGEDRRPGHRHGQARLGPRPGLRPDVAEDVLGPGAGGRARTRRRSSPTGRPRFPTFWPKGSTFYAPLAGITPGEVALLEVPPVPGSPVKMSTGVLVIYADRESFTFMTPEGHALSAWITFSAYRDHDDTVVQVQALERTSDPLIELSYMFGANRANDRFWERTLENLARSLGVATPVVDVAEGVRRPAATVAVRGQRAPQRRHAHGRGDRHRPRALGAPAAGRGLSRPSIRGHRP